MKILAVGDPHGNEKVLQIPVGEDIDAVFITGDLGKSDLIRKYFFEYVVKQGKSTWKDSLSKKELEDIYLEIINSSYEILKYFSEKKPTFYVLGNIYQVRTDVVLKDMKQYGISVPLFEDKVKNLKNLHDVSFQIIDFKGITIGGIPYFESMDWVREFSQEGNERIVAVAKEEEAPAVDFINKMQKVDILLSHIPPFGILDEVNSEHVPKDWIGKHAGNRKILEYIKKHEPELVLCGHIHEAKGKKRIGKTTIYNLGYNGDYQIIDI